MVKNTVDYGIIKTEEVTDVIFSMKNWGLNIKR